VTLLALRLAVEEEGAGRPPAERARLALARIEGVGAGAGACARGCTFCCHLRVLVTPDEAALLAEAARARPEVAARLGKNAARVADLAPSAHAALRLPCAFLGGDGACTAYAARPLACRAHTSRERAACEAVYAGALPAGAVPGDPWRRLAADALRRGLGGEPRELHAAVAAALTG